MKRRDVRILAIGFALLASVARADDVAPWEVPPTARLPDQSVDGGLRAQIPSPTIQSFKLITGPVRRGPLLCSSREDYAAAARGSAGIPELLDRLQSGATARERIGAAATLGDMGPEGRNALLALLATAPDGPVRVACVAGLPPGDATSLAAAIRWYPLPSTAKDITNVAWSDRAGCGREPFRPEAATVACLVTDLVADDIERSLRELPLLLGSADAATRRAAAWALRNAISAYAPDAPPAAERTLHRLAEDEDEIVRVAAIAPSRWSTARLSRRRIARHALDDSSALVRHAALVALSCEDAPHVPRSLMPELRHIEHDAQAPEDTRSLAAGLLLARAPARDDLDALLDACCGSCLGCTECGAGLTAIQAHLGLMTPWITEYGETHDGRRAMQHLVQLRVPLPAATCVQRLGSQDAGVRTAALQMLEMLGPPASIALPAVRAALQDADRTVRDAAARALLSIAPDELPAIRAARQSLSPAWHVGAISERTPRGTLESLVADEDERIRRSAWVALVLGASSADEAGEAAQRAREDTPDNSAAARGALVEFQRRHPRAERVHRR